MAATECGTAAAWVQSGPETGKVSDGILVMRWSSPPAAASEELARWHGRYAEALVDVEDAWVSLLRRMSGHRPARFGEQCRALGQKLDAIDRESLLPVPEPLLDLYARRLLEHLGKAARACRAGELFNVVYRLEQARGALAEIRWLLDRANLPLRPIEQATGVAEEPT